MHSSQIENCPLRTEVSPLYTVSVKIRVICHKSTVILIELRWTFSMPKNRLKSGFSAVSAHKRTPLQNNSAAGVCAFYGICGDFGQSKR